MKRTTVIATAIAATLSLGGASVALAAQSPLGSAVCGRPYAGACQTLRNACSGWNFVDADGDGVCDNWGSGNQRLRTPGCGLGQGAGFVDADGDGVCDNWGSGNQRLRTPGCGLGQGAGFVDADGDGVCDNWNGQGAGVQRGQGRGLGQGQGQGHGNGNGNGGGWGRGNR